MIAIIDYDAGNLKNVYTALTSIGLDAKITRDPQEIDNAKAIVLPGVGAFQDAILSLKSYDLVEILDKNVKSGKLLLGICLGMQLLFDTSHEDGIHQGLGYIPGEVVRFDSSQLKVPHMGWNNMVINQSDSIAKGLTHKDYVYFVHSYYARPKNFGDVVAYADYGVKVPGIVRKDNVIGMQFHPEKSAGVGNVLLENFKELIL